MQSNSPRIICEVTHLIFSVGWSLFMRLYSRDRIPDCIVKLREPVKFTSLCSENCHRDLVTSSCKRHDRLMMTSSRNAIGGSWLVLVNASIKDFKVPGFRGCVSMLVVARVVKGHHAHKKTHPHLGPSKGPRDGPDVGS